MYLGCLADDDFGQPKGGEQGAPRRRGRRAADLALKPLHCKIGVNKSCWKLLELYALQNSPSTASLQGR